MKKNVVSLFVLLVLISQLVSAQDKKNAIKLNLMSPFVKTLNLAYERVLNENLGLQLRGYYTGYANKSDDPKTKTEGFGILPEFRLYLSEKRPAPGGFFIAPFLRYDKFNVTETYEEGNVNTGSWSDFGGGLLIGHQAVFSHMVTLEAFIGPQYIWGNEGGNVQPLKFNGVLPRGGVTVGILF